MHFCTKSFVAASLMRTKNLRTSRGCRVLATVVVVWVVVLLKSTKIVVCEDQRPTNDGERVAVASSVEESGRQSESVILYFQSSLSIQNYLVTVSGSASDEARTKRFNSPKMQISQTSQMTPGRASEDAKTRWLVS